jgi:hypothetical protein
MKRLLTDFNKNIRQELERETVSKQSAANIQRAATLRDANYRQFREYANIQGGLTRQIKKATNPVTLERLNFDRERIKADKDAFRTKYENRKSEYNELTNQDYNISINLHIFKNSSKEEYRQGLVISKEKLLRKKDPAEFLMQEQAKRIRHELQESGPRLQELTDNFWDLNFTELAEYKRLNGTQRGLKILYQKALCGILMQQNGTDYDETVEENSELLEDLAEAKELGSDGSDNAPFFYVPLDTSIDIL